MRNRLEGLRSANHGSEPSPSESVGHFRAVVQSRRSNGPQELLFDVVEPGIIEPAVLLRSVSILRNCDLNLVPTLDGGDQLQGFAHAMIREEIARQC